MKDLQFNKEKSKFLKKDRGISFEEIVSIIEKEEWLDIIPHPNQAKYKNQQLYVIQFKNYIWIVPFVEGEDLIYLKTIYPSRKFTKLYLKI